MRVLVCGWVGRTKHKKLGFPLCLSVYSPRIIFNNYYCCVISMMWCMCARARLFMHAKRCVYWVHCMCVRQLRWLQTWLLSFSHKYRKSNEAGGSRSKSGDDKNGSTTRANIWMRDRGKKTAENDEKGEARSKNEKTHGQQSDLWTMDIHISMETNRESLPYLSRTYDTINDMLICKINHTFISACSVHT